MTDINENLRDAIKEIKMLRAIVQAAYEIIEETAPHRLTELNGKIRAALGEGK